MLMNEKKISNREEITDQQIIL